ncbi:MAG: MBL fold metallo-hydrolase [Planctomycetota bacterium]
MMRCVPCSLLFLLAAPALAQDHWQQPARDSFPDVFSWTTTSNAYLLRDGDAGLLIGLGDGSCVDHLKDLKVGRLEWVLFADHHREGCQGIRRVDRNVTQIAVPAGERELFESPSSFRKWYPSLGDKYTVYGASYSRPPRASIRVDRGLKAGETFRWKSWEIRCVGTPGHSPAGMTFLVRKGGKTLAFSDGLIHQGARMSHWFDSEWDYGFAKGVDTLIASVEKLRGLAIDMILPSHGPVIRDAKQELEQYVTKLRAFRAKYVRGYQVFDAPPEHCDPISKPTAVPKIHQVTPHLYKLSPEMHGKNFAIIVSDAGRGLVLDCGLFSETVLDEIIAGMKAKLGLKTIDAMWISHIHGDHFLLGPHLKKTYGTKIWTLDRIVDKCENPRRYDYSAMVYSYGTGIDGLKIDKAFRDGESLDWEGYKIQIDWMPGQTEFGCSLWLELDGKKIVFTGDNLFGSPSRASDDGHEAVVCRNSAIIEEGYLFAGQYLKNLKPDLIMGSHSYVMPEPAAFIDRYHRWAGEIIELYRGLLPDEDYEYLFDPYWVSAYPYRVDLSEKDKAQVEVSVRNFRSAPQAHRVELRLPEGITADPPVLEGLIEREGRTSYSVELRIDRKRAPKGLQIVPFDITLDGKRYGELFDFLLRGSARKSPK